VIQNLLLNPLLFGYAWRQKTTPSRKDVFNMQAPICLAKEMGIGLG